jgi:thiosulfate/3-mercaptopyruvate sulfurtransferase
MRFSLLLTLAATVGFGTGTGAAEPQYPRPQLLLEPAELAKPEVARQFIILDVRSEEAYAAGHVPGALRVDHDTWKTAFGDGKDAEGWSERIGGLGIGPQAKVVVYDDNAMRDAARIWWILRYWGLKDARLLNGGWKTWKAEGYPTSDQSPPAPEPAEFQSKARRRRLATKRQILASLATNRFQIVDARSEAEFCGIEKKDNQKSGAIPGAKRLEWSDLTDPETDRLKSPDELRTLFAEAGVELDRPTVTHCQSGGRASVMAFGMELMGARSVRNYYQSWNEWGNSEDTPVVVSEEAKKVEAAPEGADEP